MKSKTDMSKQAVTHRLKQMEGLWLLRSALADVKFVRRQNAGGNRGLEIQASIRNILLRELNSLPAKGSEAGVDRSYDHQIAPILRILVSSRRLDDLVDCLVLMNRSEAGNVDRDVERLRKVANELLELDVQIG